MPLALWLWRDEPVGCSTPEPLLQGLHLQWWLSSNHMQAVQTGLGLEQSQ